MNESFYIWNKLSGIDCIMELILPIDLWLSSIKLQVCDPWLFAHSQRMLTRLVLWLLASEQAFCRVGNWGEGKAKKACRQTFGTAVPQHPLCIRSWYKLLMARTLTVDRSDWHHLFRRHVARDLITKWQKQIYIQMLLPREELCAPVKRLSLSLEKH